MRADRWPILIALALATLSLVWCQRRPASLVPSDPARLAQLRHVHDQLHARLEKRIADDAQVRRLAEQQADVIVALRPAFAQGLIQEVAARYLDRVAVELDSIRVREAGQLKPRTFLGRVTAGEWSVELDIHRVEGVLRAGRPRVRFAGTNRLGVQVPVSLESGRGRATLRFAWDAQGIASLVCRDFDVTQDIAGRVLSRDYAVSGAFALSASTQELTARPEFPDQGFRLHVDLHPESWTEIRAALEAQDSIGRCGLALDPDAIVDKLRGLVQRGFEVKLPRKLHRSVMLPAAFRQQVEVDGRSVELSVEPRALKVTPDLIWYGATVRTRAPGAQRAGG